MAICTKMCTTFCFDKIFETLYGSKQGHVDTIQISYLKSPCLETDPQEPKFPRQFNFNSSKWLLQGYEYVLVTSKN